MKVETFTGLGLKIKLRVSVIPVSLNDAFNLTKIKKVDNKPTGSYNITPTATVTPVPEDDRVIEDPGGFGEWF